MNQRIKELAEQAEIKFESHLQHLGVDTAVIIPTDLKKFAELIVRECANIAAKNQAEDMNWDISEIIKEHFGVEE